MPRIESVTLDRASKFSVVVGGTTRTLTFSSIPAGSLTSTAAAETFINSWLATNVPEARIVVHVASVAPLSVVYIALDLDASIPPNWWTKSA